MSFANLKQETVTTYSSIYQSKSYAYQYFVCIAFAQSIIHDSHRIDISLYDLIISRLFPSNSRYDNTDLD